MTEVEKKRSYKRNRESWGRVRKLPSGRFQASYIGPDGNVYYAPQTFSDDESSLKTGRQYAREWLATVRVDIQRGSWKNPNTIQHELFGNYAKAWIDQQVNSKGESLRPRTRAEYLRYLEKGLEAFCELRLKAITSAMVRTWHAKRASIAKTAAAREARLLRAVLNTALADDLIDRNPVDSRLCRTSTGLRHRPPTEEELATILDVFTTEAPELRLAVLLAAYGGLRFSEWRALLRSDLIKDGERYLVQINKQAQRLPPRLRGQNNSSWIVGPPKSVEGERIVFLPTWLVHDIENHLEKYVGLFDNSLIFEPRGTAEYLDDQRFNRPWNIARDKLFIRGLVREHDLRAFAATYYVRGGATMREVQEFLGHGSVDAALSYQHAVGDRAGELADRMPAPTQMIRPTIELRERQFNK